MDERIPLSQQPKTRAEYRAELHASLEEARRLVAEMDLNHAEMERKRAEFAIIGARTDANLRALREQLESLRRPDSVRESAEKEREIRRLQIENARLRFRHRLPPHEGTERPLDSHD